MNKYELTNNSVVIETSHGEAMVFQILALVDIPTMGVKAGEFGGYIGHESCLSQKGDCWVFPGSKVTRGSKVTNRGQVLGNSQLVGTCVVRGNAVVDNCDLYSDIKVFGKAIVRKSKLWGGSVVAGNCRVTDSQLTNIKVTSGIIKNSTIQAMRERLTFEDEVKISNTTLDIYGETPSAKEVLHMNKVYGVELDKFNIHEATYMTNVQFLKDTSLTTGQADIKSGNVSLMEGQEGEIILDNCELELIDANLMGQGVLKGKIQLEKSSFLDLISITNDMEDPLHLHHVHASECVSFYKYCLKGRTSITNEKLRGDVVITA